MNSSENDTRKRKPEHVEIAVRNQGNYEKTSGFEKYDFIHNALPELSYDEIDTSAALLDAVFSFPLFISSMTGGYKGSEAINAKIAEFCESQKLPFGVGSQRAMIENPEETESFSIVRKKAPSAFICANIGGAQVGAGIGDSGIRRIIDSIEANALIVHLNPLQEMMQPEGDRSFKGILNGIENLSRTIGIPLIVKETGAGISADTARRLINAGVQTIDIAGAGGTSWARVENERSTHPVSRPQFNNWGIPTAGALVKMAEIKWETNVQIIASGGIRTAFDMAKALCLGADFAAMALPVIQAIHSKK